MQRIHCNLKELDKVLQGKSTDQVYTTIRQDTSGMYMFTMTDGKQYITKLADFPKSEDPPKSK